MPRKRTVKPINKFGEILLEYIESQDMTYVALQQKVNGNSTGEICQWIGGLKTGSSRKPVYPDIVSLKLLSKAIPADWFKRLWDAIPVE